MNTQSLTLCLGPMVPHRSAISAEHVRSLVDAAADAGYDSAEFWVNHHDWAVADGMRSEEFFECFSARRLSMVAAELTDKWLTTDRAAVARDNEHALDIAQRAGARSIIAVGRDFPSFDVATTGLGHLCDLAAERGLGVTLEMIPFGGVPNIAAVARIFEQVGRDNLGLCLDVWHWHRQRGGPDFDTLRAIGAERIHIFQLDDAAPVPADDLLVETLTARLLPGHGAAEIPRLLDVLEEMGASPLIASEVFSSSLAALEPAENARRQYAAMQAVLDQRQSAPGAL